MTTERALPPRPWKTAEDIRTDPDRVSGQWADLARFLCEHDHRLTDSCPECDEVGHKLEQVTPTQRATYFDIVAHGAAHLVPSSVRFVTVQALARLDLVRMRYMAEGVDPPVGRRRWTAAPHLWVEDLCADFTQTTHPNEHT